ncbi:ABC transporter ATP-binding protein [Corynebacterium sp. ES2794-CONJ1]|uniref:ABC transporter ATP-binding protein n=1 Tax=unclassified Corynebacterium TaxID=2624378 RepID=UPI00216B670F|nr:MULTISPECIES: ABC transporter ATP-binding protein [unclassified Corynebacterium]MCS4530914.1 ABC transporter ATP-binding protein [Corynebacterium sp. ES2730-CONJ]MCU9518279.1 ABC transporter ATP-binding protein [Corynebacterium sp. ES2794-CONJ1]
MDNLIGEKVFTVAAEMIGKRYRDTTVLDDITFTISSGDILGVLGPNGAGKSTLIRLISGLEEPTCGDIRVLGQRPTARVSKQALGLVPQETKLPDSLSALEMAQFVSSQFPGSPTDTDFCLKHLESWDIGQFAKKQLRSLSGGQKHRVSVALAYLGDPKLVLLDEPTTGLDTEARRLMWDKIQRQSQRGVATLLTSHYLDEVDLLADHILLLDKGRSKGYMTKAEFLRVSQATVVECTVDNPEVVQSLPSVGSCELSQGADSPSMSAGDGNGRRLKFTVSNINAFVKELVASGVNFTELRANPMSLEEAMETRLREQVTTNFEELR